MLRNTARLKHMSPEERDQAECRDQGITRPKVDDMNLAGLMIGAWTIPIALNE